MGITLRNNEFARDQAARPSVSNRTRTVSKVDFFDLLFGIGSVLAVIWWLIKIPALWIFVVSLIHILGALFNNNSPQGSDIAWGIVSFIAIFIL